jgi:hypothetical protein
LIKIQIMNQHDHNNKLLNELLTDRRKQVAQERRTTMERRQTSELPTRQTTPVSIRQTGAMPTTRQTGALPARPTSSLPLRQTGAISAQPKSIDATSIATSQPHPQLRRHSTTLTERRATGSHRYSHDDDLYLSPSIIYTAGTNIIWVVCIAVVAWLGFSISQSTNGSEILSSYYQSSNLRAAAKVIGITLPPPSPAEIAVDLVIPAGEANILGAPTVTAERIDEILRVYNSPAVGTGSYWIEYGLEFGIDPVYALAFFMHESQLGTNPNWAGHKGDGTNTHNVGNIICAGYPTCFGRFRDYQDWPTGIRDWYRLIAVEYVQGRGVATVESIIPIYAPSFENDIPTYINSVKSYVAQWRMQ